MRYLMVVLVLFLSACSHQYQMSYLQAPAATPESLALHRVGLPPAIPALDHTTLVNTRLINRNYLKLGYRSFGASVFKTTEPDPLKSAVDADNAALTQAQTVGADLVVQLPGRLTKITVLNNRCCLRETTNYIALYFIKYRYPLGVMYHDMSNADRKKIQSNYGVTTTLTVVDSPAYKAGIIPDDIITAFDDIPVDGGGSLDRYVEQHKNTTIKLTLFRDGQVLTKSVPLGG